MHVRTRIRAAKRAFSPSATPNTAEVADIVQERFANNDPVLVSLCYDLAPPLSEVALKHCMTKVRRMKKDG